MQNKKIIILVVLGLAAIISFSRGLFVSSKKNILRQSGLETAENKPPVVMNARRGTSKFNSWTRNPFVPMPKGARLEMRIVLNGIVWDANKPVAMINDKVLGVGENFNDKITVVQIKPDRVILNNGESDLELKLGQGTSQP